MKAINNYILILIITTAFASCKTKVEEPAAPTKFCLSDTMKKDVKMETVTKKIVQNAVSLSGQISANEDKWIKVFPVVGGVVEQMKVQLGDYVSKGQVLAVIHSGEIADYQSQLTYAQSNVKIAEKTLQSQKDMLAAGLATEKDVLSAETDLEKAKADRLKMQQTNNIYGSRGEATQTIVAPMSGYIIEKNVTDKMQFKADGTTPFFTIANLEEVWVMADVFESDIAKMKVGYDADITSIAYPGKTFTGKIDRLFNILDPQSRVMKVRIKIPNKDNLLKPEMFARINVRYDDGNNTMIAIPSKAIIFDKNKNFVMIYKSDCDIETREIEIAQTNGETTYIKNGLAEGEKIISEYQLLVYDAIND